MAAVCVRQHESDRPCVARSQGGGGSVPADPRGGPGRAQPLCGPRLAGQDLLGAAAWTSAQRLLRVPSSTSRRRDLLLEMTETLLASSGQRLPKKIQKRWPLVAIGFLVLVLRDLCPLSLCLKLSEGSDFRGERRNMSINYFTFTP